MNDFAKGHALELYKAGLKPNKKRLNELKFGGQVCEECKHNARQIKKESQILLKHHQYARAYALALFAIEEIGKAVGFLEICLILGTPSISPENKKRMKFLYKALQKSHEVKLKTLFEIIHRYSPKMQELFPDMAKIVCADRERSIYVDYDINKKKISCPRNLPSKFLIEMTELIHGRVDYFDTFLSEKFIKEIVGVPIQVDRHLTELYRKMRPKINVMGK